MQTAGGISGVAAMDAITASVSSIANDYTDVLVVAEMISAFAIWPILNINKREHLSSINCK
jgi:hypothetical protein